MTDSNHAEGPVDFRRGSLLTGFLLLMGVIYAVVALTYFLGGDNVRQAIPEMKNWVVILMGILGLSGVGFTVAIWKWKKWGVYGIGTIVVITFIIKVYFAVPIPKASGGFIALAILYALLRPFWKFMD